MTANDILDYLITGVLLTIGLFWVLFFVVVIPRLADERAMPKEEKNDFSFLWRRVPTTELDAYAALLSEEEKRRWYNRILVQPVSYGALFTCIFILIGLVIGGVA